MKKIKKIPALILSFCTAFNMTACNEKKPDSSEETIPETTALTNTEPTESAYSEPDISGQTIYWISDYNLNPEENENRSTALSLFNDVYGANIEYIHTDRNKIFETIDERILSGEPVDMVPYQINSVPEGVIKNIYQPLDDYFDVLEWDSELWEDMHETAEMFSYDGNHYVIPYSISDPFVITYSRKLMKSEKLDDPYELYKQGKWDWNTFNQMTEKFISQQTEYTRYGIAGYFGEACLYSTGKTVVSLEDGKLVNNINDSEISKAEEFMTKTADIYNDGWHSSFPQNMNTLFYAMQDWSIKESNALNPDADLMIVPFPKSPDSDKYYMYANYNARMLVKGSDKGNAVAEYIKCERLAETSEKYKDAKKALATQKITTPKGITVGYITDEQYDALQEYTDPTKLTPVFDFGYGMGSVMYGEGNYDFETRGIMNRLAYEFIEQKGNAESWEKLREICSGTIDEEIKKLQKG